MSRKLVAYFSATGTTARAARRLVEELGADLFEIRPSQPYTGADLNWNDSGSRVNQEHRDPASRPAIADKVQDMAQYDTVFLGFPIWWYTAPRIIQSFLESYDFSGKTIHLFATSGGSGLGGTQNDLTPSAPGAMWADGAMMNGRAYAPADWRR